MHPAPLPVRDLGRMSYADAYDVQARCVAEILNARASAAPIPGRILMVEHDPVVTVSRRATAAGNLIATPDRLRALGIGVEQTDRGGDITYHGPGQLVVYPIVDLNLLNLGLHDYMRLLEGAAIGACGAFGVRAQREAGVTGVWVPGSARARGGEGAKICAMGVRVRSWVSMHGLALNVDPDFEHFGTIVPCGLAGRAVTSLRAELGGAAPAMGEVRRVMGEMLNERFARAAEAAGAARAGARA